MPTRRIIGRLSEAAIDCENCVQAVNLEALNLSIRAANLALAPFAARQIGAYGLKFGAGMFEQNLLGAF